MAAFNQNGWPDWAGIRILLAVTGLTPQVVTETLYALRVERQPPFIPTEIHLLTTAEGAEAARLGLLSADPGWFQRLCRDYELPAMTCDASHIQVLRDADGAHRGGPQGRDERRIFRPAQIPCQ